jgi:hypothetical protein
MSNELFNERTDNDHIKLSGIIKKLEQQLIQSRSEKVQQENVLRDVIQKLSQENRDLRQAVEDAEVIADKETKNVILKDRIIKSINLDLRAANTEIKHLKIALSQINTRIAEAVDKERSEWQKKSRFNSGLVRDVRQDNDVLRHQLFKERDVHGRSLSPSRFHSAATAGHNSKSSSIIVIEESYSANMDSFRTLENKGDHDDHPSYMETARVVDDDYDKTAECRGDHDDHPSYMETARVVDDDHDKTAEYQGEGEVHQYLEEINGPLAGGDLLCKPNQSITPSVSVDLARIADTVLRKKITADDATIWYLRLRYPSLFIISITFDSDYLVL